MNTKYNTSRSLHRVVVRFAVIASFASLSTLHGQILISGPPGFANLFKDTVGYAFTVKDNPLSAHRLGVFDASGNGLDSMNIIGLWQEGGTLLATAILPSGSSAPLESGFRWFDLTTPVLLNANTTYRIGVQADLEMHPSGFATGLVSPDITLIGAVRNNQQGNFSYPGSSPFPDQAIAGPNLAYTVVPEPSTVVLVLFGLIAVLLYSRRIRKTCPIGQS